MFTEKDLIAGETVLVSNDTCQIMVVDYRKGPGARGRGMDAKTILSKA